MPTKEERIRELKELAESKAKAENKSKRLQVLITPSMYDSLQDWKTKTGLSVNEIVNKALAEYIKD